MQLSSAVPSTLSAIAGASLTFVQEDFIIPGIVLAANIFTIIACWWNNSPHLSHCWLVEIVPGKGSHHTDQ